MHRCGTARHAGGSSGGVGGMGGGRGRGRGAGADAGRGRGPGGPPGLSERNDWNCSMEDRDLKEKELAAIIMEEAALLRDRAARDGVAAYLAKPPVRGRPNPQFLQATVRSIQQSNKIVEVNEMWRRRSVELEYEQSRDRRVARNRSDSQFQANKSNDNSEIEDIREDGLGDDELEQFLRSRVKRGRGAVGSRMDETGPYLPLPNQTMADVRVKEDWEDRIGGTEAGPSLPDDHQRDWKRKKSKSKRRSPSVIEEEHEKRKHKKRKKERKEGR